MKKTALMELNKWLTDKWSDPGKLISCVEVSDKIKDLLPKEKQDLIDAFDRGKMEGRSMHEPHIKPKYFNSESYFKTTFEDE